MLFKVRVRATGAERTVTPAAYAAKGPKIYEKLGVVDDNGNETAVDPNRNSPQVLKSVSGAAPVVVRQIEVPQPTKVEEPQPEAPQEQTEQKENKKPGRNPRKESISSNSDANGQ